ncbi:hypothetical protein D9756_009422 [Leucocoprinus leucothites]|uniref:Hypervirulence associated protein TUDOR domain-containing protein n=1 Tax=Leucocoprinus leucothites TaxID=201217 RepID=A0A8H5CW70_9AGAR|nr:hypothetical protein D9756_009422 [Leucoagaricus leucothites]
MNVLLRFQRFHRSFIKSSNTFSNIPVRRFSKASMADKDIEVGNKVQWNYGAGHPQGVAAEIKTQPGEKVQIKSKKGNIVSRNADEENPAVRVERQGDGNNQDVVKRMSELEKVGEGEGGGGVAEGKEEEVGKEKGKEGVEKEVVVGEKRDRETVEEQDKAQEEAKLAEQGEESMTEDEKVNEEENKEPAAKKARVGKKDGEDKKEPTEKQPPTAPKATRSRGRGRGKATTTTTDARRTSGRAKKGSVTSQERATKTAVSGEGEKVEGASGEVDEVVMGEITPGEAEEEEQGAKVAPGQAPAGHTRSKDVQATAHN